jgi:hypothetical protein
VVAHQEVGHPEQHAPRVLDDRELPEPRDGFVEINRPDSGS